MNAMYGTNISTPDQKDFPKCNLGRNLLPKDVTP